MPADLVEAERAIAELMPGTVEARIRLLRDGKPSGVPKRAASAALQANHDGPTGNQTGTQLWPRFGREFSKLVAERGTKSSARLTQIGGAVDIRLP